MSVFNGLVHSWVAFLLGCGAACLAARSAARSEERRSLCDGGVLARWGTPFMVGCP